jgi:hypothetical protein
MRLLVEILVIAGLIYLGWDKPFKEWAAKSGAITSSKIHVPAWEDNSPVPSVPAATQTRTDRARSSPKRP